MTLCGKARWISLISDGQNQATMKGFGDTRDNIPAILELAGGGSADHEPGGGGNDM